MPYLLPLCKIIMHSSQAKEDIVITSTQFKLDMSNTMGN